jgi:DNA-binding response OmpR family regulator
MPADTSILLVEDETDLAELICYNLRREGYECRHATAGDAAMAEVRRQQPDLILLDRMLPDRPGDEVASQIRRDPQTSSIPIIMLTAKSEETDQLVGFALGADDYITKPFSMKLLTARVSAILRRRREQAEEGNILTHGPIVLDRDRHEITVSGSPAHLTATEFRLLAALMSARGRVLDRTRLMDKILGPGTVVTDRTIDVHVTGLRKKLAAADPDAQAAGWVHTVRGVGYAFREPRDG